MAVAKKDKAPESGRRRRGRGGPSPPLPLYKRSSSHFQAGDRQRGTNYYRDGRVEFEVQGTRAHAKVQGTERGFYRVGVDWARVPGKRKLHAFCECERFGGGRPCKHLWATLLALADSGPENQPQGRDRVGLRKDGPANWQDLGVTVTVAPRAQPSRGRRRSNRRQRGGGRAAPTWQSQLDTLREEIERPQPPVAAAKSGRDVRFLVNTAASAAARSVILDVFQGRPDGGKLKTSQVEPEELERLLRGSAGRDERPMPLLTALPTDPPRGRGRGRRGGPKPPASTSIRRFELPAALYDPVLPELAERGALGWWDGRPRAGLHALEYDSGPPWRLALRLEVTSASARLIGGLERKGESLPLTAPLLVIAPPAKTATAGDAGFLVFPETLAPLESASDGAWIEALRELGEIVVPKEELAEALASLLELPGLPLIEAPEEYRFSEEESSLQPRLVLESDMASVLPDPPLLAKLSFVYGNVEVGAEDSRPAVIDWQERTFLRRDMEAEHKALLRLLESGVRPVASGNGHDLEISPRDLPMLAEPLLASGWEVEVRGTTLRLPNPPRLRVESGIDWFELSGDTDIAGDSFELKEILEAVSRGDRFLDLEDGSQGLLPASWMETYGSLAQLAQGDGDEGLRFLSSQAALVDVLLSTMPPADADRSFGKLRERLKSFDRIKPRKEPRGFHGELRGYQREGLGWLEFLREFGLGGVLADDMGLGKTVQVLALLRANRTPTKTTGLPSLVVAPRSLVYNWVEEASRFTPSLRVVEYLGPGREALRDKLDEFDVLVTTYGTLRRDIDYLATVDFDTLVLDEAQAIKNRESQAAKASRLLRARHKLALTGTPIENHLGELGSLFEVLNPGLLGSLPRLDVLISGRTASQNELKLVAEGIRPFILRRTKAQVLEDLPPKTEQVLYCTLHPEQRKLYDKLRAAYQASLLREVEGDGKRPNTIQVLEALLRLRQVACHPGLVDPEWEEAGSTKLDTLFEQVDEVLDEGHKIIVFSQFTKLLAYVRQRMDEKGISYAYLDGQTRNRGEVVERFQTDDTCNLFLISLKAGGLGLNLTAAGYVFLLDPWWNPAVEAQAIDRAHRIGQTQPVFAYRMIARDTVEEKIIELQKTKRKLADAVLEGEQEGLGNLTADDLKVLLG